MNQKNKTVKISYLALLTAVATLLMIFSFPVGFLPAFYKFDFSETVSLIAGFLFGPVSGVVVQFLKNLLKMILKGSSTYGIGELSNFLVGCTLVVPSSIMSSKNKVNKNIFWPLLVGTLSMTICSAVMNIFILLPVYSNLFSLDLYLLVNQNIILYTLITIVPFNFVKAATSCCLFALVYGKIRRSLNLNKY